MIRRQREFIVAGTGTDLQQHIAEVAGRFVFRKIQIGVVVADEDQVRPVEPFDDGIKTGFAIVILETVFFGRNHDQRAAVPVFQCAHLDRVFGNAGGADGRQQVTADRIGIGMFQLVRLGDNKGIVVVADHIQHAGIRLDVDIELGLDLRRRITAGGIVVFVFGGTGNGLCRCGRRNGAEEKQTGKQAMGMKLIHSSSAPSARMHPPGRLCWRGRFRG